MLSAKLVVVVCVGLVVAGLAPRELKAQGTEQEAKQQLIAADRGLLEAVAGPHPKMEQYIQALAADYVDIEFGAVHSREEVLKQTPSLQDFTFQYENPRAVLLSPTSGYVIAEVHYSAVLQGAGIDDRVLSTTLFTWEKGRWLARLQSSMPLKQSQGAAAVPDSDPTLVALRKLAGEVEDKVHVPGYGAFPRPPILLDAGTSISNFSYGDGIVHETQFGDLPAPMQGIWNQWASYTSDQATGKALFDDMFHRFFFVHELGHWMAARVIAGLPEGERQKTAKNESGHLWEVEIAANRIAIAWYREHDPAYLSKLVADFRQIQSHLPDPVPAGMDKKKYFTENYRKLSADPMAYGWYQLQMVLVVYDEPARSFQQVLDDLPRNRYE